MSRENKKRVINQLFDNKFNEEHFKEFITNVLNVRITNNVNIFDEIDTVFKNYIENFHIISDYEDTEKNQILLMTVKVKNDKDPVRARTKQREFVAKMLRKWQKDGAVVVFYNEADKQWRISFVRLSYEFTMKGIKEALTPAKRSSYVVGEGESNKTVKDQFLSLIKIEDSVSLNQIEEIFALEKVTSDFFNEYKNKYLAIKKRLLSDKIFMEEAKKHDSEDPESFADGFSKKLMGQISFIYFLQKKGWLGIKIAPEKLTSEEFDRIYNRALDREREILITVYDRTDFNTMELQKDKLLTYKEQEDAENFVRPFYNTEYFSEWGTGDKKFIRSLFELHKAQDKNNGKTFFDDYLEVLFYNNLSRFRGELQYSLDFNCRIPFLNGGLFDPYGNYNWKDTNFNLEDEIFSNEKKDGILDIFDRYNFTINENDSYETEVAVDPEMLGKVFENLLEESKRKTNGAFYTPREIVKYMCNESIMNYLLTNLKDTSITKEDLDYLFNLGEFTKEYDEQLYEQDYLKKKESLKDENGNSKLGMPKEIILNARRIDELLVELRIADPACGSGAFPLGLLNEIVRARNILTFYIILTEVSKEKDEANYWNRLDKAQRLRSLYILKQETIQNSLYGVDKEPSAIDITRLRLWLSILVDSNNNNVRPLPNLDFNFMIGNSLVEEFEGTKLFDEKLLTKTKHGKKVTKMKLEFSVDDAIENYFNLQKEFFNPYSKKKEKLKQQLLDLETRIIGYVLLKEDHEDVFKEIEKIKTHRKKPYFIWKLFFGKVFQEKGGFDIVIGNPPYVRLQKMKEESEKLSTYNFQTYEKTGDLYCLFYEKGIEILKEEGILGFITSNKWLRASYGKKLREFFLKETNPQLLIDLGAGIFETATVDSNILITKKEKNSNEFKGLDLTKIEDFSDFTMYYEKISKLEFSSDDIWTIDSNIEKNIKLKIEKLGVPLKDWNIEIKRGILTGFNEAFIIDEKTKNKLVEEDTKSLELIKPLLRGRDIKRYSVEYQKLYLINSHNGYGDISRIDINNYPAIKKYLDNYYPQLEKRSDKGETPYNLRNCAYVEEFEKEKIIYPETTQGAYFYYDTQGYYIDKTCFMFISKHPKYLLATLSSKLFEYAYKKLFSSIALGGKGWQYNKHALEKLPIKKISSTEEAKINEKVDSIIPKYKTLIKYKTKFINRLSTNLEIKKITSKLENFQDLEFKDFLKELEKQKIKLSLKDQDEWQEYFEISKNEMIKELIEVEKLDKEIDEMVYDLYELTEEEKNLVREF